MIWRGQKAQITILHSWTGAMMAKNEKNSVNRKLVRVSKDIAHRGAEYVREFEA